MRALPVPKERREIADIASEGSGRDGLKALELGSGRNPVRDSGWWKSGDMDIYDFVNVDIFYPADVKHDLNQIPYPFEDDTFDAIFARHTLEHIRRDRLLDAMEEIYRVGRNGALVYIRVPYWTSEGYPNDPTHWSPFTEGTFQCFCYGNSLGIDHIRPLFEAVSVEYRFHPKTRLIPMFILRRLSHLLIGICEELWIVLRVRKDPEASQLTYSPQRTYAHNTSLWYNRAINHK